MTDRLRFKAPWTLAVPLILAMTFSAATLAQDCNPNDIVLDSQADVDNFQANHGPCHVVFGRLTIAGDDIVSLGGLAGLDVVGDLIITNNPVLTQIDGLSGLTDIVRDLEVSHNENLVDIDGVANVTDIGRNILIWDNSDLEDLDGLTRLTEVDGNLEVRNNDTLSDLDGLSRIVLVGGDMSVDANSMIPNLDGLRSLVQVGGTFRIQRENMLDIDGMSRLTRVGGKLIIVSTSLPDIDGLSGVISVGSDLWILSNPHLQNLDGLGDLSSARNVLVEDNLALDDCQGLVRLIDPIDHAAPGPGPGTDGIPDVADMVTIQNNRDGCNSLLEILRDVEFFNINAGLNDAWFDPETPGQGFFIIVLPHLKQVFMAWFTYDTERPPEDVVAYLGEPGHRWITAQGAYEKNVATLTVYVTSGGVFDSPVPETVTTADGEMILEFDTCNSGTVTYDIPSIDRQGVVPIERIALDNVAQCYLLGNPLPDAE